MYSDEVTFPARKQIKQGIIYNNKGEHYAVSKTC